MEPNPKVSLTNKITGKVTVVTPSSANATELVITLPALEAGIYAVRARVDPIGESNMSLLTVNMNINGVSAGSISIHGGNIKILGTGFPSTWPNDHYNRMALNISTRNLPLNILSISTTQIVLKVPAGLNGRSYTFSLTTPMAVTKSTGFSQQNSATPNISYVGTPVIAPNTQTLITLNQTNTASATIKAVVPELVQIYSLSNPSVAFNVPTFTNSTSVITFNVTLNSGMYGFRLFDEIYGWYNSSGALLNVTQSNTTTYTTSDPVTPTSFNGGVVNITGDYIGDGAVITVNGFKSTVLSRTEKYAIFNVPTLVTPSTQTAF